MEDAAVQAERRALLDQSADKGVASRKTIPPAFNNVLESRVGSGTERERERERPSTLMYAYIVYPPEFLSIQ